MSVSAAETLVRLLRAEGVGWSFGVVGGKLAPLLKAHAQSSEGPRFVGVRHEASGPMMAAAIYAAGGGMAVAMAEMGPGALNLTAGMGSAWANHWPVLAITSNQSRSAAYPHRGMFMDLDNRAMTSPVTKWGAVVGDARRLPELVQRAFREARTGRPGPVHLDIPADVLASTEAMSETTYLPEPVRYRAVMGPRPSLQLVGQAIELIRHAHRPLIVAGGGAVAANAGNLLERLSKRLSAPIVTTQMGLGLVPSDAAANIGPGGIISGPTVARAFDNTDLVISVGCRHSSWLWDAAGPLARKSKHHIAINIDPSALGLGLLHDVAMQADARLALEDLMDAWPQNEVAATESGWLDGLARQRREYLSLLRSAPPKVDGVMHPGALALAIGSALPGNALAVFDGGHTSFWSNDCTPVKTTRTRFHDPGMCQLGFGLPFALGLKLCHPDQPIFHITGDGAFGFSIVELDTARRYGLPVITIVHNNASWGVIRAGQRKQWGFELETSLDGTDYAAIARGFGCFGEVVTEIDEIGPAIRRAMESGLPAVLDCRTAFVPHPCMPQFGEMNRFDFQAV